MDGINARLRGRGGSGGGGGIIGGEAAAAAATAGVRPTIRVTPAARTATAEPLPRLPPFPMTGSTIPPIPPAATTTTATSFVALPPPPMASPASMNALHMAAEAAISLTRAQAASSVPSSSSFPRTGERQQLLQEKGVRWMKLHRRRLLLIRCGCCSMALRRTDRRGTTLAFLHVRCLYLCVLFLPPSVHEQQQQQQQQQ